jgi:hypothetical protein
MPQPPVQTGEDPVVWNPRAASALLVTDRDRMRQKKGGSDPLNSSSPPRRRLTLIAAGTALLWSLTLCGEPVAVRHSEGIVHGFLALRTASGATIADGDLIQLARGTRVTSRLAFHFKDGSLQEETVVFSQQGHFQLISDHLVQKGPAFPLPVDMFIDATGGEVTVHYAGDHGERKEAGEHMNLPPDLANGLVLTLLKNANPKAPPKSLSFVAATPRPRLIKLAVTSVKEEPFVTGGQHRIAVHYVLRVEIGGFTGILARLFGRQPPDSHVWILGGEAPAFVKSEQPLYPSGPVWRIELVSPVWPRIAGSARQ